MRRPTPRHRTHDARLHATHDQPLPGTRHTRHRVAALGSLLLAAPLLAVPPAAGGTSAPAASPPRPGTPSGIDVHEVRAAAVERPASPRLAALSRPAPVTGYGVVGATWRGAAPAGLRLAVRTRTGARWSAWTPLHHDADHGPDAAGPDTADRDTAGDTAGGPPTPRPGTDPMAVGEVDAVQLRAATRTGEAPTGLRLSVVDPGTRPEGRSDMSAPARASALAPALPDPVGEDTSGVRAPRPRLRTRAEWGADESLRSGSPAYGQVEAGFVHHTVNANAYSRADVPAIIRGIYGYHTQSRGWSDIGYNFLVDRFGRIWVGRYGGPRRPVVGAHTYGYNDDATGVAGIGDLETGRPSAEMVRAFGRLLGWKLGLHGVRAGDRTRDLDGTWFRAVSGHRDGGQTACPGRFLYSRLDDVRRVAVRRQQR